jgi:hypothetical protein
MRSVVFTSFSHGYVKLQFRLEITVILCKFTLIMRKYKFVQIFRNILSTQTKWSDSLFHPAFSLLHNFPAVQFSAPNPSTRFRLQ